VVELLDDLGGQRRRPQRAKDLDFHVPPIRHSDNRAAASRGAASWLGKYHVNASANRRSAHCVPRSPALAVARWSFTARAAYRRPFCRIRRGPTRLRSRTNRIGRWSSTATPLAETTDNIVVSGTRTSPQRSQKIPQPPNCLIEQRGLRARSAAVAARAGPGALNPLVGGHVKGALGNRARFQGTRGPAARRHAGTPVSSNT
jgi:hypothetical protein